MNIFFHIVNLNFKRCASVVALATAAFSPLVMAQPKSLCALTETTVFSCSMTKTGQILSICSSATASKNNSLLYYTLGKTKNRAYKYPKQSVLPKDVFNQGHLMFGGGTGGAYLSFKNRYNKYIVYSISGAQGYEKQGLLTVPIGADYASSESSCKRSSVIENEAASTIFKDAGLTEDENISKYGLPKPSRKSK